MNITLRSLTKTAGVLAVAGLFAACDDTAGPGSPASVALNFQVGSGSPQAVGPAMTSGSTRAGGPMMVAGPPLMLQGTNGTLTIEEIRLIVAEVELEGDDDACDTGAPETDDCADFEAPPRFLDLPLDGSPVEAFVGLIPPGTYFELEFEVEDLEDDETDPQLAAEIAALRAQILQEFPDWPEKASALVVGSFDDGQGNVTPFRVYLEAEIEIERDLIPPLVIGEGGGNPDLTVDVRPDIWFGNPDGSVLELHLWDYDATGQTLEFELEMEAGITEIEIETDG